MFQPRNLEERVAESFAPGAKTAPYSFSPVFETTKYPPVGQDDLSGVVIPTNPGVDLYEFQKHGILAIARRGNVLLADEQGLGKTAQTIHAINFLGIKKALIICPTSLIPNWESELHEFLTDKSIRVVTYSTLSDKKQQVQKGPIAGTKFFSFLDGKERIKCASQESPAFDILVVGDSSFQKDRTGGNLFDIIRTFKFELAVIDEVHRFKNPGASRTRIVIGSMPDPETGEVEHRGLISKIPKKWFLSGTPLVNAKLEEFYHLLATLDKRSFGNFSLFQSRYQSKTKSVEGRLVVETKNDQFLSLQLRESVMIRRLSRDVLDLPPMSIRAIPLADTPAIAEARALLEAEVAKIIKEGGRGGKSVEDLIKDIEGWINDPDESIMAESEEIAAEMQAIDDAMAVPGLSKDELRALSERKNEIYAMAESRQARGSVDAPFSLISKMRSLIGEAKCLAAPSAIYTYIMDLAQKGLFSKKAVIFYHHQSARNILMQGLIKVFAEEPVKNGRQPIILTPENFAFIDGRNEKLVWSNSEKRYVTIPWTQTPEVRHAAVQAFQKDDKIKFFLASMDTAATGITLTKANTVIFAEQDWTPAKMQQAMYRIYRIGQKASSVNAGILYVQNSIDANIAEKLILKKDFQRAILDRIPTVDNMDKYKREYSLTDAARLGRYNPETRAAFRQIIERLYKAFYLATDGRMSVSFNYYTNMIYGLNPDFEPPATVKAFLGDGKPYGERPAYRCLESLRSAKAAVHDINSTTFNENLIDELMPLIWACRGWKCNKLVPYQRQPMLVIEAPMLKEIPIPPEITGKESASSPASPIEMNNRVSIFQIMNSASAEGRRMIRRDRLEDRNRRRAEEAIKAADALASEEDETGSED